MSATTWRTWPPGIPRNRSLREQKLEQVRAELRRPVTPETRAEDRQRTADKKAKDMGLEGLLL